MGLFCVTTTGGGHKFPWLPPPRNPFRINEKTAKTYNKCCLKTSGPSHLPKPVWSSWLKPEMVRPKRACSNVTRATDVAHSLTDRCLRLNF